jgi:hypothetical protein
MRSPYLKRALFGATALVGLAVSWQLADYLPDDPDRATIVPWALTLKQLRYVHAPYPYGGKFPTVGKTAIQGDKETERLLSLK